MNEDARKNTSPELEVQNNEQNEDQLDEVTGGIAGFTVIPILCNRRCTANLSHFFMHTAQTMYVPSAAQKPSLKYDQ